MSYDPCPMCKGDFKSCPHSVVQVDEYRRKNAVAKETRKNVLRILKEFNLIPSNAK